jgi:Tol biopolymer transport system component
MLGVGGMGEVYRARDSRLNRDVAIKVLREDGMASADKRSRFEREARAVAALNHPNIVSVYDFGVGAGQQFIVSELIDGESLRALLRSKPLPVRKLIDIATQVADGLAAAHAAGFVHRDLKPENVMLAKDGRVKILDFGLARQSKVSNDSGETAVYQDPSATFISHGDGSPGITQAGAILGTAHYMSPEQALGHDIDYRSDQFSLGLILYEMASGKQAFAKPSGVETMAAIVHEEPPALDEKLPPPLRWIIDRCLAKEPEQRYESTRDLYRDLKSLRDHFSEAYTTTAVAPVVTQPRAQQWKLIAAIGAGCAVVLALITAYLLKPTGQNIGKYLYSPFANDAMSAVWSPDGKAIAYSSRVNGIYQVFLRYLNSPVPIQLTHEKHTVQALGWSNDRSHVIVREFTDKGEPPYDTLYSVPTVGGELESIMDFDCDTCDLSRDGKVLATLRKGKDNNYNVEISDPVGSPLRPYAPAPFATKELYNVPHLYFAPDGKSILLFRSGDNDQDEAWLLPYPLEGKPPQRVLKLLPAIQYTPSFSWMPDGRHIVVALAANENAPTHLWMADVESNNLTPLTTGTLNEISPVVAPDGKSLLYSQQTENLDIISVSIEDGSTRTLLSSGREESMASWAANQPKLAWVTNRSGPYEIWLRQPDGSDRPVVTAADFSSETNRGFMNPALSPDGNRIIYTRIDNAGVTRLWISSLAGGSPVRLTSFERDSEYGGVWSPDGTRFAYLQILAGRQSLMTVKTSGNATPTLLKDLGEGYYLPDWSPAGNWITYRDDKGWNLISPDGKTAKFLGKIDSHYLAFSKDGRLLYGIQTGTGADEDHPMLFSLDPATGKQKTIRDLGREFRPSSTWVPGIRFSLSPDGKSFVYGTVKERIDIWMLQGYRLPGWQGILGGL